MQIPSITNDRDVYWKVHHYARLRNCLLPDCSSLLFSLLIACLFFIFQNQSHRNLFFVTTLLSEFKCIATKTLRHKARTLCEPPRLHGKIWVHFFHNDLISFATSDKSLLS